MESFPFNHGDRDYHTLVKHSWLHGIVHIADSKGGKATIQGDAVFRNNISFMDAGALCAGQNTTMTITKTPMAAIIVFPALGAFSGNKLQGVIYRD